VVGTVTVVFPLVTCGVESLGSSTRVLGS